MPHKAEIATNVAYVASGSAVVVGGLELNQWAAIIGITLGFATFIINWIYRHLNYRLQKKIADGGNKSAR